MLVLGCVLLGGCAPEIRVGPLESLADYVVGPARAPELLVDASTLIAPRAEWRRYRAVADDDGRESVAVLIASVESPNGATWRVEDSTGRIVFLRAQDDGTWISPRVDDLPHNATMHYTPPIVELPASLDPAEPSVSRAAMRVVSRDNPNAQLDRGTCEQTVTYEAMQRLRTPAGTYDCHRIRIDYTADLNLAKVHRQTWRFLCPDVGLVAEVSREQVTAMLLGWKTERTIVLESVQPTVINADLDLRNR